MLRRCASALIVGLAVAAGTAAEAERVLPLTVAERLAACAGVEDSDPARAVALADSVVAESRSLTLTQRIDALGCRGWAQAMLGRRDDARRDAHEMRSLLQLHPVNPDRARLTRRVGTVLHRSGDRIGAVELWALALADAEAQGLEAERIPLLINLGVLHSEFEEHERAQVNYEQALALMARLGDHRHEAPVRYNLGLNLNGQERFAEAVPHLQRATELVASTGAGGPTQHAAVRVALATALQRSGDAEGAREQLAQVRAMDLPLQNSETRALIHMIEADQLVAAGDVEGALATLDSIDAAQLQEIQKASLLRARVSNLERLGRFEEAAATLREINVSREAHLRHQNHERLAALETHLRDREQRLELERLQTAAELQERRLAATARLQWVTTLAAGLLLLLGTGVLLWQRRMNRRLDQISRTDPLTGLFNRRDMAMRLRAHSTGAAGTAAVLLVDIDLFKRINDVHGHDSGDRVLVVFSERLRACVGASASVARWGGEEFLVLLPEADLEAARAMSESLRTDLAKPIDTGKTQVQVEVSIGFANLPLCGERAPDAWHHSLQLADSALYLAKSSGRNAWAGYWVEQPLPEWPSERIGREARLARAQGVISLHASRSIREPLAAVS